MTTTRGLLLLAGAAIAHAAVHRDSRGLMPLDARVNHPLAELLAYPVEATLDDVDAVIQQTLALCRLHGVSSIVRSASIQRGEGSASSSTGDTQENLEDGQEELQELPPADVEFCHRVRFVRLARQRHRARDVALRVHTEMLAMQQQEQDQGEAPQRNDHAVGAAGVEVRRADELAYQTFFETYAERNTPVVVTQRSFEGIGLRGSDDVGSFLRACFPSDANRVAATTMRIADDACRPWLDQFQVPVLAVNNFVPRTELSLAPTFLPTLLTVAEASAEARPAHHVACPFGLHTALLPVDGAVEYQLSDAQFMPLAPPPPDESDFAEVSLSADAGTATTFDGSRVFRGRDAAFVGAAYRGTLDVGHTLFVPGGRYVPLLSGVAHVLRFCVVDASNLNHVTETVRVDALVSGVARRLFLAMQAPAFDASMARRPSQADTLWANYLLWPKEAKKLLKRRDMVSAESDHVPLSRRERLKLWQDDKRWERRVKSLTLPVPLPPVVMNATRSSVTLRWQDLYERPRNDITPYGYEVRWRREDVVVEEEVPRAMSEEADREDGAVETIRSKGAINFTHAQLERSAMPTTLFGDEFDGKDIEGVVRGLAAEATYAFSVRIYVGETFGVASERSRSAQTAACAVPERVPGVVAAANDSVGTCVAMRWLAPSDDGGRRVTSYLFAFKNVGESRLASLQGVSHTAQLGDQERLSVLQMPEAKATTKQARTPSPVWLSGSVCDQLPGRVQVRVAAVNAIGVGAWSKASAPMRMATDRPPREVPTVRGRGDPAFLGSPDNVLHRPSDSGSSTRPRVVLSDVLQQMVVTAPLSTGKGNASAESRLEVWAGHYSPRRFHVSSELVLADPLDAAQPLRNAADVRDRVVVVLRGGGVPFLFKLRHAQRAGALGVVFVDDAHDRCARGFDQSCVPGATKRRGEGFGATDRHPLWREARIPFVLMQREPSAALLDRLRPDAT